MYAFVLIALLAADPAPQAAAPAAPTVSPTPREAAKNFAEDVKLLFKVAACGRMDVPLGTIDERAVNGHCADLQPLIDHYTKFWSENIEPLLAQIVPREKATTVVYPFGGGDLVTALGTYPNVSDLTTLSLEVVGDVRGFTKLTPAQLKTELQTARKNLELLYRVKHSKTDNLGDMTRGGLSGQLVFALTALRLRGYEPVALRYFTVNDQGALDFLSDDDVKQNDAALAEKKIKEREHTFAFGNAEIEYRRVGETQTRFFRHMGANLDDEHLAKTPGIMTFLEKKGRVFAMTKAASYLLWWPQFGKVRDYLSKNVDYMISDSTGLPPDIATQNGFRQYTFGDFAGPYLNDANARVAELFKDMWKKQPKRPMGFRYGYPDVEKNAHMLVTTKLEWNEPKK
ncbi:MAG: hypothetical protein IT381_16055 [Deltaproteobacteria bacterium]|nr:hypothetical protein [Deltaproteobacteria bacterium]